jgi:hypothetical protein
LTLLLPLLLPLLFLSSFDSPLRHLPRPLVEDLGEVLRLSARLLRNLHDSAAAVQL